MKILRNIALTILTLVLVLFLAKNLIAKVAIEKGVQFMTGLRLNMGNFDMGVASTKLGIRDLKLYNPRGFSDPVMLDMPEIYVDYELMPFFKQKVHLPEIRIHLKEFLVVKNEKGELNLDSLKAVQSQKKPEEKKPEPMPEKKGKAPEIQIDKFQLRVEKVILKDYSKGGDKPSVTEFNVNLNEQYSNITNPYGVVSIIISRALLNTTIASITNFDLGPLNASVSDALASSQKIAGEAMDLAQQKMLEATKQADVLLGDSTKVLGDVTGDLNKAAKSLTGDLTDTAGSLKDKLKLPFGQKE